MNVSDKGFSEDAVFLCKDAENSTLILKGPVFIKKNDTEPPDQADHDQDGKISPGCWILWTWRYFKRKYDAGQSIFNLMITGRGGYWLDQELNPDKHNKVPIHLKKV